MRRIPSGDTAQWIVFEGPATGLDVSDFTVWRKRGSGSWTQMTLTGADITENDPTNAPAVYSMILNEDMTISGGALTEGMAFLVTHGPWRKLLQIELIAN